MALEREKYIVYVQDENEAVTAHHVTIHHVDMTRGEVMLHLEGVPRDAGLNLGTAWCWAALTRMGLYSRSFPQFRDMDCVGLEDDGKDVVDPTQPGTPEPSA